MNVSRLDTVVMNNVSFSENKKDIEQAVYILQDISVTLAMIYDELHGKNNSGDDASKD